MKLKDLQEMAIITGKALEIDEFKRAPRSPNIEVEVFLAFFFLFFHYVFP